jgi:hypothetical protein
MKRCLIVVLVVFGTANFTAAQHPEAIHAVVRLPSHGASATVIATAPGKTLLLSCAHAFEGTDLRKPIVVDVPSSHPALPQAAGVVVLKVDYAADLSLLQLRAGPVDFVAPVAPHAVATSTQVVSVGYDGMRVPAVQAPARLLSQIGLTTYTVERPGHGRSGGALLDLDSGCLIGVVQGYEVTGWRRGMYVSHRAIVHFLSDSRGWDNEKGRPGDNGTNPVQPFAFSPGPLVPLSGFCPT